MFNNNDVVARGAPLWDEIRLARRFSTSLSYSLPTYEHFGERRLYVSYFVESFHRHLPIGTAREQVSEKDIEIALIEAVSEIKDDVCTHYYHDSIEYARISFQETFSKFEPVFNDGKTISLAGNKHVTVPAAQSRFDDCMDCYNRLLEKKVSDIESFSTETQKLRAAIQSLFKITDDMNQVLNQLALAQQELLKRSEDLRVSQNQFRIAVVAVCVTAVTAILNFGLEWYKLGKSDSSALFGDTLPIKIEIVSSPASSQSTENISREADSKVSQENQAEVTQSQSHPPE